MAASIFSKPRTRGTRSKRRRARTTPHTGPSKLLAATRTVSPEACAELGKQLRQIAARLTRIEHYLIVAGQALNEQEGYNAYIRTLLRVAVGHSLFKQIRSIEDLAGQVDGRPGSERDHDDDPAEDEDTGAA
jgi:hypothetical protein